MSDRVGMGKGTEGVRRNDGGGRDGEKDGRENQVTSLGKTIPQS